jgi:phosphopantothenoylcysteine decarboxylase/phosphopantothenate--cysteine ligase
MNIVLGICGSIASYRSAEVVKALMTHGHLVRCALTAGGKEFVSVKALETFSGQSVMMPDMFGADHFATDHIATARWANAFIIYGATANFLARLAHGMGDDFLTLQLLAFNGPVILAPAMNPTMWLNAAVTHNVAILKSRGYHFVEPIPGIVACGESGVGHVASDESIMATLGAVCSGRSYTSPPPQTVATATASQPPRQVRVLSRLQGRHILISAGPMRTAIDPVRYIQNRSSGRMGLALAKACAEAGAASVKILLGPVDSDMRTQFQAYQVTPYQSPNDYIKSLMSLFPSCDIFFSAAAVLDFDVVAQSKKLDRNAIALAGKLEVALRPVPDIVAAFATQKLPHQTVIAFAAETGTDEDIIARATNKMMSKSVDAIIANPVADGVGPDSAYNKIWIIRRNQEPMVFGPAPKVDIGTAIIETLFEAKPA